MNNRTDIPLGSIVKINHTKGRYSSYRSFFVDNDVTEYLDGFDAMNDDYDGSGIPNLKEKFFRVVYKGKHGSNICTDMYLLVGITSEDVFLFDNHTGSLLFVELDNGEELE